MIKKVFAMFAAVFLGGLFTGCESARNDVQGYSIRSYQGPLPLADLRRVNPEAYGVPVSPR